MTPVTGRKLSGLERAWLVADRIQHPFVFHYIIEGEGELSAATLEAAVGDAARANPGASLCLKGVLGGCRWQPGAPPAFRVVEAPGWDGRSERGAEFLNDPMCLREGPTIEVVKVTGGDRPRVVVRIHHGVMDGEGAWIYIRDLFAALRGEALEGSAAGPWTDRDVARGVVARRIGEPPADRAALTGHAQGADTRSIWRCVRLEGKFREVLPRTIVALWQASRQTTNDSLRVAIPVNLRRYRPDYRSTANLTGVLRVDLADGRDMARAIPTLRAQIDQGLARCDAAAQVLSADGVTGLPIWLMAWLGERYALRQLARGQFTVSATISNLGLRDLDAVSTPDFAARRVYLVPPGAPSMPMFIMMSGDADGVNLVAMTPAALGSDGRLDGLLERTCDAFMRG